MNAQRTPLSPRFLACSCALYDEGRRSNLESQVITAVVTDAQRGSCTWGTKSTLCNPGACPYPSTSSIRIPVGHTDSAEKDGPSSSLSCVASRQTMC